MDKAFIESYYRTYNSEDPESLSRFYHDDVELISSQGVQAGVESILATYRYLISVFHDQMTPQKITISGNRAVVEIVDRFEAKQSINDFMGMKLSQGDCFELNLRATYEVEGAKFKTITIEQIPHQVPGPGVK